MLFLCFSSRVLKTCFVVEVWSPSCVQLFCNPMDCSPLGSVHGLFQARILEWVAISFSRGSSWTRSQIHVSCIGRWILYHWATRGALNLLYLNFFVWWPLETNMMNLSGFFRERCLCFYWRLPSPFDLVNESSCKRVGNDRATKRSNNNIHHSHARAASQRGAESLVKVSGWSWTPYLNITRGLYWRIRYSYS